MMPPLDAFAEQLQPLFTRLLTSNPFIDNRVTGLGPDDVDIEDIHTAEFAGLQSLAREACSNRRGVGALLWGEAGIGKSHLLARLLRWAEKEHQAFPVFLPNLQASSANLPRAILKSVIVTLTRGQTQRFTNTPLYAMLVGFIRDACRDRKDQFTPWPIIEHAYYRQVDRLGARDSSRAGLMDRTTFTILYTFFHCANRAARGKMTEMPAQLAVRWLSGEALDPEEAATLRLPPSGSDEATALVDGQQIKQVLVCLGQLALSVQRPLILCFDQVDNLDEDQAAALARFMEALIDGVPNLLLVTTGIKSSLLRWKDARIIQDSAWDRIAQFEIFPQRLRAAPAQRIVAARIAAFRQGFEHLDVVRSFVERDPLFPLHSRWAEGFLARRIEFRPREILNEAREEWQREQDALRRLGGTSWLEHWNDGPVSPDTASCTKQEEPLEDLIDRLLDGQIAEFRQAAQANPDSLPADNDILTDVIGALLKQQDGLRVKSPPTGKPGINAPYHLEVSRSENSSDLLACTWIRFVSTTSATSTTAALRQLVQVEIPPERMFIVTEERLPLVLGNSEGSKGKEYLEELQNRPADLCQFVELTFDQFAYLSALQSMVRQARSGDLEIARANGSGHTLSEEEVVASHRRQCRYQKAAILHDFLGQPELVHVESLQVPSGNYSSRGSK